MCALKVALVNGAEREMSGLNSLSDAALRIVAVAQHSSNAVARVENLVEMLANMQGAEAAKSVITELRTYAAEAQRAGTQGAIALGYAIDSLPAAAKNSDSPAFTAAVRAAMEAPGRGAAAEPVGQHPMLRIASAQAATSSAIKSVDDVINALTPPAGRELAERITDPKLGYAIEDRADALGAALADCELRQGLAAAQAKLTDLKTFSRIAWAVTDGRYNAGLAIPDILTSLRDTHPDVAARYETPNLELVALPQLAGFTFTGTPAERKRVILAILAAAFPADATQKRLANSGDRMLVELRPLWHTGNVQMQLGGGYEIYAPPGIDTRVRDNVSALASVGTPAKIYDDAPSSRQPENWVWSVIARVLYDNGAGRQRMDGIQAEQGELRSRRSRADAGTGRWRGARQRAPEQDSRSTRHQR